MEITLCDIHYDRAEYKIDYKFMWIPITIDKYVKIHLQKNPNENEKVLRVRIEAALDEYKNGVKCQCGKDIWIVGSAFSPILSGSHLFA